jgi:hypothetical protein
MKPSLISTAAIASLLTAALIIGGVQYFPSATGQQSAQAVLAIQRVTATLGVLSASQGQALKADIAANTNTVSFGGTPVAINALPNNDDANFAIADWYNLTASPAWVVWRSNIPTKDVKLAIVWTEYIARSQGERDAFEFMLSNGTINGADANIRQGIQDVFSGPSGATTRANLTALAKRSATNAEKLYSTGAGTDGSPATVTREGPISFQDVSFARSLP